MTGNDLLRSLDSEAAADTFARLYGRGGVHASRQRYRTLIEEFTRDTSDWFPRVEFPETSGDIRVFSAPGRTELGGNHTDHNRGKVLAASIQLDSVAIAAPRKDKKVFFRSVGHPDVMVDISELSIRPEEKGTTEALVRGIAAEFTRRGTPVGGVSINAASQVMSGSGLSSSAVVEVLFGRIFDCLYGNGKRSALEIAQIGQKAENNYFGKPCGLMDQTACAAGGAVAIDFENPAEPRIKQVEFDLAPLGTALCVVNTGGSHADLTADYAAIPAEMKTVAACFGKTVLREVDPAMILNNAEKIRKAAGDRALLRAIHFFNENQRVDTMVKALEEMSSSLFPEDSQRALGVFLTQVNRSGDSSWELLQNIYAPHHSKEQGLTLALALTRDFLEKNCRNRGAYRVHGGGFAGTIQAYIPMDALAEYQKHMETFFGPGSVTVLSIRPLGAIELKF
jgi:galactokinase